MRNPHLPNRFVTIDSRLSHSALLKMQQRLGAEYIASDTRCEVYTLSEKHRGIFEIKNIDPKNHHHVSHILNE